MPDYLPYWLQRSGKGYQFMLTTGKPGDVFHANEPAEFGLIALREGKPLKFMGLKS